MSNMMRSSWSVHEIKAFFERCVPGLKWHGNEGIGHCPLSSHNGPDRNPSFSVNKEKGCWFCHCENRGGGIVALSKETGVALPSWRIK